jgi:hypothetical protein
MAPGDERRAKIWRLTFHLRANERSDPRLAFEVEKGYTSPFGTPEQDDKRGWRFDLIPADAP